MDQNVTVNGHEVHYEGLPESLQEGMRRYIEQGVEPGHFMSAVLANDLFAAIDRADLDNQWLLGRIVRWIFNEAPSKCWGSRAAVEAWIKDHRG